MKRTHLIIVIFVCLWAVVCAADEEKGKKTQSDKADKTEKKKELKLEDLFPEKSLFGPSARSMAFSQDGKYAAYLYRPYKERRHGNDLYIYDVAKGKARRITWPSVMAKFQKSSRKVVEDRIEKAKKEKPARDDEKKEGEKKEDDKEKDKKDKDKEQKKDEDEKKEKTKDALPDGDSAGKEKNAGEKKKGAKKDCGRKEDAKCGDKEKKSEDKKEGDCAKSDKDADKKGDEEDQLKKRGDWVSDKDADDEKAPKYSGIGRLKWSPVSNEILLDSEGDIYRYKVCADKLIRLTHTRNRESYFDWLPDASGYVYKRQSSVMKIVFGSDFARQIDPKFPNGDELERHRISPDGRHIAFLTSKEIKAQTASKVEIANYRDRLMKAKEVSRHVSDDPLPVREKRIYLYEISDNDDEKDELIEVFKGETHMPDDMVKAPVWSPDSKKIAFMTFEQDPALVKIYEAKVPEKTEDNDDKDDKDKKADTKDVDESEDDKDKDKDEKKDAEESDKDDESKPDKAKEIFRFLHHGGPNTPRMMEFYYLADNKRIVYLSEQTGFRHLHLLDPLYESFKPLTSGRFEVYPIDISKDRKWVFVRATKEHPSQTDVYRVSTGNGKMIRLTKDKGTHSSAAVSEDGTKVLTNMVSYEKLKELIFIDTKAKVHKTLTDSHPEKAHKFAEPKPEFFDYKNRCGHKLYGMMFKPDGWSKKGKRPVLIYFYGGPLGTRKQVTQGSFSSNIYAFPYYMARKHGYVACTIDTRGNSGYAGVFEKANFGRVGKPQVEDLVDGVKFLIDNYGVDKEKVSIHGWSFGGFQTQMCMYTEPDVFGVGIAGAGPTEWENYNAWYTRHTIGKSEPGKATLKEFSLLPLAKNLKGHLLLVHGMEDSNVLYQDTVRIYRELLKAGKETLVELFLDPTGGHGLGGDVKTLSRYRKYEQFLLRTIGRYESKADEAKSTGKKAKDKKNTKKKGKKDAA